MPSAKKTPICGIHKADQSVTARYNFVVEPGLLVSPLQGGPGFSVACGGGPGSYGPEKWVKLCIAPGLLRATIGFGW